MLIVNNHLFDFRRFQWLPSVPYMGDMMNIRSLPLKELLSNICFKCTWLASLFVHVMHSAPAPQEERLLKIN